MDRKILRLSHRLKKSHDEVFVVEQSYVVQACVLVQVSWLKEVIKTELRAHDLAEQAVVAGLDHALEVGHLRTTQLDINHS